MAYKDMDKMRLFFRTRYRKNIEWLNALKIQKGCADCGYNEHAAGLEFDHVQPRLRGSVASQLGKSLKVIQDEVARCEVVCGTCHNIRTWKRRTMLLSSSELG